MYSSHMCSPHSACLHLSVTSERWQMAGWSNTVRKTPSELTPGRRSDVTTTSAVGSSHGPVATGDCGSIRREDEPEVSAEQNNKGDSARDDRKDNDSIGLTAEIIPLLYCSYTIPPKHLIFAQLLIFAPSFHVFFIYLSSGPVYLLLLRLSCSPGRQISLVEAAALLCLL